MCWIEGGWHREEGGRRSGIGWGRAGRGRDKGGEIGREGKGGREGIYWMGLKWDGVGFWELGELS